MCLDVDIVLALKLTTFGCFVKIAFSSQNKRKNIASVWRRRTVL